MLRQRLQREIASFVHSLSLLPTSTFRFLNNVAHQSQPDSPRRSQGLQSSYLLPPLRFVPPSLPPPSSRKTQLTLSPSRSCTTAPSTSSSVLPAGPAFSAHASRILNQRTFADEDALLQAELAKNGNKVEEEDDADAGLGDEQEEKSLLLSDPKLWKVRFLTSFIT